MAGGSSKKEKRRARREEKQSKNSVTFTISKCSSLPYDPNTVIKVPAEEFYKQTNDEMNKIPVVGKVMDGVLRTMVRAGTVPAWTRRFGALTSLFGRTFVWLQLLMVDENKDAQLKMYALGSRVALDDNDTDVVERSRQLFKDAVPTFLNDYGLWIYSHSLVKKNYNGSIADALEFSEYDPLGSLKEFPMDSPPGIRCAEIFLFFAVDGEVPGDDLSSREAVMAFLNGLNSKDGNRKIHAFTVTGASVVADKDKLKELRGEHVSV